MLPGDRTIPQVTAPGRQSQSQPEEEDEAEEDEAEELGHAETYADYVPSKCECPARGKPQQATSGQHSLREPALSGQGCRVPGVPEGSLPGYLKPQRQVWELQRFCNRGCNPCFPQNRRQAEAVAERQAAFPRLPTQEGFVGPPRSRRALVGSALCPALPLPLPGRAPPMPAPGRPKTLTTPPTLSRPRP